MAGWKKLLLGAGVGAALLLVTLLVLVQVFVTPERVREQLQTGLQQALSREVSLGQVDVGLLRGIDLEQLVIRSRTGSEPLLAAERLKVSFNLLAVLTGKVQFDEVQIIAPRLRLERDAEGRLSISDLLGGGDKTAAASASPEAQGAGSVPAGSPVPLVIKRLRLAGGDLHFVDRSMNPASPYLYRLEGLNLQVDDFSLDEPFSAQLEAQLNDAPVKAGIDYSLNLGLLGLQLRADKLSLVPFLPYLKESFPGTLHQGLLSTDLKLRQGKEELEVSGQLILDEVDTTLYLDEPLRWQGVRISLDPDLRYRAADHILAIDGLKLDLNGVHAAYVGKLLLGDQPHLAGKGTLEIADLRKLEQLLPVEYREHLVRLGASGSLAAEFQFDGIASKLATLQDAQITATDLQASFGELRPALSGKLNFKTDRLQGEGLKLDLKGQALTLDLDARKLFDKVPDIQLAVRGDKIDLDSIFPPAEAGKGDEAAPSATTGAAGAAKTETPPAPFQLPLRGLASLRLAGLKARGLDFNDLAADLSLAAEQVELKSLSANLGGGRLELKGVAQPAQKGMPLRGEYAASGVAIGGVADAFLPEGKGSVTGTLSGTGTFSTSAFAADPLAALHSNGRFDLREGQISGSPLLAGLASFLTNPELRVVSFSSFAGSYSLKAGQGTVDAALDSSRIRTQPKGSFSLKGPLNLALPVQLAPAVVAKSGVGGKGAEWLKDDQGWSLLPLKVKGSYSSPKFRLDSRATRKQVQKGLSRELGKKLKKKLGIPADGKQSEDSVQQLMDGALKKLFGK